MFLVTVDQGLSGASNILVLLFIAHLLSPGDFGYFALLFLGYGMASTACRALICQPVLVHPEDTDERPRSVLGSAIWFSVLVAAVCLLIGAGMLALGAVVATSVIWLGVLLPLMLVQDVGRYLAISAAQPVRAIVLDTAWILLEVGGFLGVAAYGEPTLPLCVVVWGATGALSGLLVFVQVGVPRLRELNVDWLRSRWDFSWRSLATTMTTEASTLIGFSAVTLVSTPVALGAVRAATLLTRPATMVVNGVAHSTVADLSRDRPDDARLRAAVRKALLVSLVAALGNLAVLVVLPDVVGEAVLGNTWHVAEPLLLAAGLQLVMVAARNGIRSALLSRRQIRLIMAADIAGGLLLIVLTFVGAVVGDALGMIWAGVIAQGIMTVAWMLLFRRRLDAPADVVDRRRQHRA
jgi:O-antigen/teichoic acid export membrane protein